MITISDIQKKYKGKIDALDLQLLIAHHLRKTREFVLTHPEFEISKARQKKIQADVKKRIAGMPLAYLTGHKEFFGLDFLVSKSTLIPRPETEIMVQRALDLLRIQTKLCFDRKSLLCSNMSIVDVGTGSGCIAISVARNSGRSVFAVEPSARALDVAKKNAKNHVQEKNVIFLKGKYLLPAAKKAKNKNLLVLANLPYLSKEVYKNSPKTVKKFEPKKALFSGKDGLDDYRKLLGEMEKLQEEKKFGFTALLEISPEQSKKIQKEIQAIFPETEIQIIQDLAGKDRVVEFAV